MMQLVVSELSGGAGDRDFPWLQIESPAAPTEEAMRYNDAALAVSSGRTGKSEVVRPHPIITTTDEEPSRNAYNYYGVTNTRSLESNTFSLFFKFCASGARLNRMDVTLFHKLCMECGVVGRGITTSIIEVAFQQVSSGGSKYISFPQFREALGILADRMGVSLTSLEQQILRYKGSYAGGLAQRQKSWSTEMLEEALYSTASHPADTMAGGQSNAGSIDDRIAALMDQQPDSPDTPLDAQSALSSPSAPPSVWSRSSSSARAFRPDQVRSVYLSFCSPVAGCHPRHRRLSEGGNGSVSQGPDFGMMDGAAFAKICRELSLFGSGPAGKVYSGKADAIFFAVKDQGSRRISFEQFCKAMEAIASETNTPVKKLFRRIAASSKQPPNANKTGNEAQVHGGDSCPGLSEPLRNMRLKGTPPCAASGNLAPTKPPFAAAPPRARLGPRKSHTFDMSHGPAAPAPPGQMRPSETTQHEADPLASEKDEQSWALQRFAGGKVRPSSAFTSSSHGNSRDSDFSRARDGSERPKDADDVMFHVKCTYLAYCQARASIKESGFNGIGLQRPAMHGSTFARLCRQCKLTSTKHGSLSLACVDNIFKKVKQQGENKINFAAFVTALHHIAEEKDVEPWEGVLRVVASKMGPDPGGIVPDAVSLYDDKPINVQVSRQLHSVFLSYIPKDAEGCAVSGGRMSDHSFTLFCKRSAIVGELLADMIYVVVKPQAADGITYQQFTDALRLAAKRKPAPFDVIVRRAINSHQDMWLPPSFQ